MVIKPEELTKIPEFSEKTETELKHMQDAIEQLIRVYTNNNFQNRYVRFYATSDGNRLYGVSEFLSVGDTIQISQSGVNDGLYYITDIGEDFIEVDKKLFSITSNLVTKVEYPDDIKFGVINIMKWEVENRKKVGIKSETLSRHSTTYFDLDASNQVMGYPVSLLGFLNSYMKARF
jgi:hypothetical protein